MRMGRSEQKSTLLSVRPYLENRSSQQELYPLLTSQISVVPIAAYLVAELEVNSDLGIEIVWHEWPILGEASNAAARAVLAAQRQGADQAFRDHLLASSFVPNSAYLMDLGERLGLDPSRLAADMSAADVNDQIAKSNDLASLLGFRGTPGLVVGRTLVNGAIDDAELMTLIERERADGPVPGCARDNPQN